MQLNGKRIRAVFTLVPPSIPSKVAASPDSRSDSQRRSRGGDDMTKALRCGLGTLVFVLAAGLVWADEVTDWNQMMLRVGLVAATSPLNMTRVAALTQAAVFDAVNGIDRRYTPVHVHAGRTGGRVAARGDRAGRVRDHGKILRSGRRVHAEPAGDAGRAANGSAGGHRCSRDRLSRPVASDRMTLAVPTLTRRRSGSMADSGGRHRTIHTRARRRTASDTRNSRRRSRGRSTRRRSSARSSRGRPHSEARSTRPSSTKRSPRAAR